MLEKMRRYLDRHPLVRDAIYWAIPALIFGAFLRGLLLHYLPYAYWGSDSKSYFSFAFRFLDSWDITLDEKRRYLYPILLLPASLLPGSPLAWVAWLQHALGVATIIPMAYVVRRSFTAWKVWIIPITLLFGAMPIVLWYEHELLGDALFIHLLVWTFAGWVGWVSAETESRRRTLWWYFIVPCFLFLITKPTGRFIWPGVFCGLALVGAWKLLRWRDWSVVVAMLLVTLTVGSRKQGAWLLYVASFPLTQVDTPKHAEYKAQIRDLVLPLRAAADNYYLLDDEPFALLENPEKMTGKPLWTALDENATLRAKIYMDLALEGAMAEPVTFLHFGVQRMVASMNFSQFRDNRFDRGYYATRLKHHYEEAQEALARGGRTPFPILFALPRKTMMPPYEVFSPRLERAGWSAGCFRWWSELYSNSLDVVKMPDRKAPKRGLSEARPTFLGVMLVLGLVTSLAMSRYRRTLGVWALVGFGYAMGTFLFGQMNPRYFVPAWPVLLPLFLVPLDALWTVVIRKKESTPVP